MDEGKRKGDTMQIKKLKPCIQAKDHEKKDWHQSLKNEIIFFIFMLGITFMILGFLKWYPLPEPTITLTADHAQARFMILVGAFLVLFTSVFSGLVFLCNRFIWNR